MKIDELRTLISQVLAEAKKKKEKSDKAKVKPEPPAYSYAEAFDFSAPLGAYNLYHNQGVVNWGPQTSGGPRVDDQVTVPSAAALTQEAVSGFIGKLMNEQAVSQSEWDVFQEHVENGPEGIWESALHWYDFNRRGLGEMAPCPSSEDTVDEKKLGFKKLKNKLAHKKGVTDPAALAASIGRKKYGAAGMAKKAAAGRKK